MWRGLCYGILFGVGCGGGGGERDAGCVAARGMWYATHTRLRQRDG